MVRQLDLVNPGNVYIGNQTPESVGQVDTPQDKHAD